MTNNINFVRFVIFQAQNAPKSIFLDPAGGAYDAFQTPLSAGEGDTPSPFLSSLDAFGVSKCNDLEMKASRLRLSGPLNTKSSLRQ